jgi:chemotaxis signal transduction protein
MDQLSHASDAQPSVAPLDSVERAQAVRCGQYSLAVLHGWARALLESFELSAVPGAPAWLAGATNVEGEVVPVIDLQAWMAPGEFTDITSKNTRLLVGGLGEDAVGLLFEGLPRIARVQRHTSTLTTDKLAPFAIGTAEDDTNTIAIDAPALLEALIAELMTS